MIVSSTPDGRVYISFNGRPYTIRRMTGAGAW
jgi:hypothetical protein